MRYHTHNVQLPPCPTPSIPPRAALLDHLPKDLILARYQAAAGAELASGKFASPESSAALVANAFGFFADRPGLLNLPCPPLTAGEARAVHLEAEMRFPWHGGRHPWLDVAVETETALIGVESKRYEPFRKGRPGSFSDAYARPVWGDAMAPFESMRDALQGGRSFRLLDACQLVKHALGLRTQARRQDRRATLLYLYAEPAAFPDSRPIPPADHAAHRAELAAFTAEVTGAEVAFCSLSYPELLRHWAAKPALADHVERLAARFDV
ncbi:MAG: hypothetical protein ABI306_07870 [Caulobacteraceae bacterium]